MVFIHRTNLKGKIENEIDLHIKKKRLKKRVYILTLSQFLAEVIYIAGFQVSIF